MNRSEYETVMLGSSISEVVAELGPPYKIISLGEGGQEYEYIERLSMNGEFAYENHYYLKVVDGQVVSKRYSQENRPAYDLMYEADPNYPNLRRNGWSD